MSNTKNFLRRTLPLLTLTLISCTTEKYYPTNFVESLKHPTKFPEVFTFNVQNIEDVTEKNPLGENEEVKITDVGENKNSSMHLIQVRPNGEIYPHYHKRHDEVIYVKKGSGIATLNDTRYVIKPGSILQIPIKTGHKFLNTGDETFVAVSIFSPPYDGKDEKKIKQKKKRERINKEEKRLVSKKSENNAKDKNTYAVNEPRADKVQTAMAKQGTEKVIEKRLNKPVQEELDTDAEMLQPPPTQKKLSASDGKKKPRKQVSTESTETSSVDIKDLHEKLTKLVALKEEGVISEEEYEEKKDLLVKGKGIGELPEPKGHVKRKMVLDDDEPVLPQLEKSVHPDKNVSDEDRDTMSSTPHLYRESKPTVSEFASEEKELSSEDKLNMLEEMRQEGLITDEDYESKREAIIGTNEKVVSAPFADVSAEEKYESEEVLNAVNNTKPHTNSIPDEKIKELRTLYNEGLITDDDYQCKLKELLGAQSLNPSSVIPVENGINDDKLSELNELKEQGLISDEDYAYKKVQLIGK